MIAAVVATQPDAISIEGFGAWCRRAATWPRPGSGRTGRRFELLAAVARSDLVMGRLVEAHADATTIMAEIGNRPPAAGARWAVWAAGPPSSVVGQRTAGGWRLGGTKHWCSGAGLVDHALVDASTDDGQRLFAVHLNQSGVDLLPPTWVGPGMARADTRSVSLDGAAAEEVGDPGQYLSRPGFWAGAVGVAACWHGGTTAVAAALLDRARRGGDGHLMAHLGAVHAALSENRAALAAAASHIDAHWDTDHLVLALTARTTIEANAREVMDRVGRALGPEPLAHNAVHAATVADLAVYVRQHHAEKDLAEIGTRVSEQVDPWPL